MSELVTTSFTPVEIIRSNHLLTRESIMLTSGQNLNSGQVLGEVSATGKYVAYAPTAHDGSEVAAGILAYTTNAGTTGQNRDVDTVMYTGGEFYASKLTTLDANAIDNLNGRLIPGLDVFKF